MGMDINKTMMMAVLFFFLLDISTSSNDNQSSEADKKKKEKEESDALGSHFNKYITDAASALWQVNCGKLNWTISAGW